MPRARGNEAAARAESSNSNNNENSQYARTAVLTQGLTPLGQRPISSLVPTGPFRGMPAALVQQTLAVMPQLVAQGPQALRGQRGLAAAAVPAVASGFGGGGGGGPLGTGGTGGIVMLAPGDTMEDDF